MIDAERFVDAALARGFGLYTGVPCSYLTPFINHVLNRQAVAKRDRAGRSQSPGDSAAAPATLRYIGAANEGDAVAIAAGAELGGLRGIAMFQNSGLGNAVNPLTSLAWVSRIPILLIVTWRGEPGGAADEPQHELMGGITTRLLDLMQIPWAAFPDNATGIDSALDRACDFMAREGRPYALILRKGSVADSVLEARPEEPRPRRTGASVPARATATRRQLLASLQSALKPDDVVIATTGYTGRELYALGDRACQFYMVGSMGCASSMGLGLAIARPDKRVIVIDGDGAALMRLGAMTTIGTERPSNLLHVLFDNAMHESTGGQATVSPNVDFCAIATACGYRTTITVTDPDQLREDVDWRAPGLRFIHVPVRPGVPAELPRPAEPPTGVAGRLRAYLGERHAAPTDRETAP